MAGWVKQPHPFSSSLPTPPVYPKPLGGVGDRARGERGKGDGAVTLFPLFFFLYFFFKKALVLKAAPG